MIGTLTTQKCENDKNKAQVMLEQSVKRTVNSTWGRYSHEIKGLEQRVKGTKAIILDSKRGKLNA